VRDSAVYGNVYFRVEAGYVWGKGMPRQKTRAYYEEVVPLLQGVGFNEWQDWPELSMHGACPRGFRGIEHLYCHPMDLSGWVRVDAIPAIEKALRNGSIFKPRSTDIVRQAMNYTPEEYRKALEPKREELEAKLIDLLTTTRKNKYARPDRAIKLVPTIKQPYGRGSNELAAVAGAFQAEVIRSLVEAGRLTQTNINGMDYYRAPRCGRRIGKVAP
jgi:hypothetical protein